MQNNQYCYLKKACGNCVMSALAISSLLLVVTGCDSIMNETKPTDSVVNTSSNVDNASLPDKSKHNSDYKAVSKDGFIATDDAASTPDGIEKVITANNQFGIDMYQQINGQSELADKNVFFSPYSLSTAMAMLYAAAEGETKAQIQKTFYYPSMDILNPNSAALYNQFNKPNPNYDLSTVNNLWMQQGLTPNKAYVDTVQRYYGGQVTNLDLQNSSETSRQTINKTIANHTKQMIPELLPKGSIKSDTVTVLTNAVYFKGDWQMPFSQTSTSNKPFYPFKGQSTDVKMMYQQADLSYTEDDQVQVVQLPYKGDDLSMLVILLKAKGAAAMQQVVKDLTPAKLKRWTSDAKIEDVQLSLPKFKLQEDYKMKSLLIDMGMPIAFNKQSDFSLFNVDMPLFVDSVIHKAVIEVDEKGTKAAAATGIVVATESASAPPITFKADHPFIFMIKDNKTDAILFLGQVNKP